MGSRVLARALIRLQVVDETDRLLRQSYQNWLPLVVEACARPQAASVGDPCAACIAHRGLLFAVPLQTSTCVAPAGSMLCTAGSTCFAVWLGPLLSCLA